MSDRERARRSRLREIGEPPPPPDGIKAPSAKMRAACRTDLAKFCRKAFPEDFALKWSQAHYDAIKTLQGAILDGETFALAMPRGSGKSTLVRAASIWAVLFGHRQFVCIVGASQPHADEELQKIKTELESNDHLYAWFPELLWPIREAQGNWQRARNLTFRGERQHIEWASHDCTLPCQPGQAGSEGTFAARGILSSIRGMSRKRRDGKTIRPDFAVIDDPQTDETAASPSGCDKRERVLKRAVLQLAGPKVKIAAAMLCTVIRRGDLADRILDKERNPEWQGQRTRMLLSLPDRLDLWEGEYDSLRKRGFRDGVGLKYATEFYRQHRKEMDCGAVASWADRFNDDELSAIQNAMNLRLRDPAGFAAEQQQEPVEEGDDTALTEKVVLSKVSRHSVGVCPSDVLKVTASIDVQDRLLYWAAVGWQDGFSGQVLGYGCYPPQPDPYYTYESARVTLATKYPGGPDAQRHAGLRDLIAQLDRAWAVEEGGLSRTDLVQIDGGAYTRQIREVIRQLVHSGGVPLIWSKGVGIGAARRPLNEGHKRKRGEHIGAEWRRQWTTDPPRQRWVQYDANWWKSFLRDRLATAPGDRGCLMLHAGDHYYHQMIAEHCTAEMSVRTFAADGRGVDEWRPKPGRSDNHLWDCLVGCAVAASQLGIKLDEDLDSSAGGESRRRVQLPRRLR